MSLQPDLPYWLALVRFPLFGATRIGACMRAFPDMERAFFASRTELLHAGIPAPVADKFIAAREHINPLQEQEQLARADIHVTTRRDETYPALLAQLYDPPPVLFYRGTLPSSDQKHLAVVGSRKCTTYGIRAVKHIVGPLARAGVVIVSGLAYGVDAHAHEQTLREHGITMAVLGSGVDTASIYPASHRALAAEIIASGGVVLSEFPINTLPRAFHFPYRNRVIAGISHGTLVIEATQKSGSLITAKSALENGRDVYAVPGPFDHTLSEGPNNLLKMGAIPVTTASDIFPASSPVSAESSVVPSYIPTTELERLILSFIKDQPLHLDEVALQIPHPIDQLSSTVTLLEMKGVLKHDGGRIYRRIS